MIAAALGLSCLEGVFLYLLYRTAMEDLWIWQAGTCGEHLEKKSLRLFMAASILIALYGGLAFGFWHIQYFGFCLFAGMLAVLSVIDIRTRLIPDKVLVVWLALAAVYYLMIGDRILVLNRILAAAVAGMLFGGIAFLKKDSIGWGDVKLIAMCALMKGMPGIMLFLLRGMLFVLVYALFLILVRKAKTTAEIPFAPFMLLAALL